MSLFEPFGVPEQQGLRSETRRVLAADRVNCEIRKARTDPDASSNHAWHTYHELGRHGLLAPHWPETYGGRGAPVTALGAVTEEIALAGVPDSAHVNTVCNIGATLLQFGTPEQKAHYLPRFASGEFIGCVLYSELEAGSDLGTLTTSAVPTGTGWRLNGSKLWNVLAPEATVGICAARVDDGRNQYAQISLFLVPLSDQFVGVQPVNTVSPETLYVVNLNNLHIPADALVGTPGMGWEMINAVLPLERNGLIYYGRARRWLYLAYQLLTESDIQPSDRLMADLDILDGQLEAARTYAWTGFHLLHEGEDIHAHSANAKWWASELAASTADVCRQAVQQCALDPTAANSEAATELRLALRQRPSLTLAAGTSEILLTIASENLLGECADGAQPQRLAEATVGKG